MDAEALAVALAKRITSVIDTELRVGYVRHELSQLEASVIADLVAVVAARATARDRDHRDLLLAISVAMADQALEPLRREVASIASSRGMQDVARLLDAGASPLHLGDDPPRVPDFGLGRPLTLGERKSLARRRDRALIARVLEDPHPDVIRIALRNPALTEDDVVRLCARRPLRPDVVREVFRSARWMVRSRVRSALARNPYTPLDLALQIAAQLNAQEAREIAASPELSEELRETCRRVSGDGTLH